MGCAGLDGLVVVDVDLDDLAGDAGADLVEVAVDLGVVGVFGEGGAPVEEAGADDEQDDDGDDDELAAGFLRGDLGFVGCCVRAAGAGWSVRSGCPACSACSGKLLSSEIIFVVGLGDAQGTGQRELGYVVLVERADVLVVGLLGLRLGLRDGQVVGDAGVEALLRFAERLVGEVDVGVGGVDELGGGLDVEEAVADVLIDLLDLVGELGFGLLVLGVGYLLLSAGLGDLEDGDADLAGGGEGAVGVAGGGADVAVVAGGADDGILVGLGGALRRVWRL